MESSDTLRPLKITTVGDGAIGKTCMLITYTTTKFPEDYIPTVFDNYAGKIAVDGEQFSMTLWDTAGQEDFERLRPLSYPNTNCFIMCYSIGNRSSYENIETKWYPEIKHFSPSAPIVLVGTKSDLRETESKDDLARLVTVAEGKRLRKKIKAAYFLECSALKSEGLEDVIVAAVRACVQKPAVKSRPCRFL